MGLVRKIKAGLVKVSVNDFVGEDGNVFFDVEDGIMRLSDGATPGGIPLSSGGDGGASTFRQLLDTPSSFSGAGGNFVKVNPQASAIEFVDVDLFDGDYNSLSNLPSLFNPSDITQSLVPRTDVAIDLGTSDKKWRDLYLSGSTIYLGDATISRNANGSIDLPAGSRVGGVVIGTGSGSGVTSYNELTDLPTLFSGNYNDLTNKPTIPTVPTTISSFTNDAGYLTSIGTISYNDLTDKPTIPTDISELTDNNNVLASSGAGYVLPVATNSSLGGIKIGSGLSINGSGVVSVTAAGVTSYNELTDTPDLSVYQLAATAFDGAYNSLTGLPTLFSGAYADLTGAPDLSVYQLASTAFSGDYNDLINTPSIPTVPTTISSFTNDSGYITGYTVTQSDVTQHQAALLITESQISDFGTYEPADATILKSAAIGVTVQAYDANIVSDANYAHITVTSTSVTDGTTTFNQYDDTALAGRVTTLEGAGYLTSVAFADLTITPTTLAGYGITDVYTITQADAAITTAVNNILGGAPQLLDTLDEIAQALGDDPNFVTNVNTAISLKANTADLAVVATSGSYTDLSNTPTIPTDISELTDNNNRLAATGITEDDLFTYSLIF